MALKDTAKAIRRVTELLIYHLNDRTTLLVEEGRPEAPKNNSSAKLNLFLYEAIFDPSLKNVPLDEGQPAPLWLVLKYLMTAFDKEGDSDSRDAHEYLGKGIRALQELSFLPITDSMADALKDNPEVLKITFDETPADLLSKLMQGPDEKYRFSIGFQVRPVMIAPGETPSYSLLVGVKYTDPSKIIGEEGVQIPVIPSMGPALTHISPSKFQVNDTLTIFGSNLNLSGLSVRLGTADLAVTAQKPDRLECKVNGTIEGGGVISAGSHPISVVLTLPNGRRRSSNLLVGDLLPRLDDATFTLDTDPDVYGELKMTGILLGSEEDDIFVALFKDGKVVRVFDEFIPIPPPPPPPPVPPQTQMRLKMEQDHAVPPGKYRVILRVNGQQAKNSPEVNLVV